MKKNNLINRIRFIEYAESILKHLADTILWQLISGNLHIARRFWQNIPGNKTLEETNYQSVLSVANNINSNPDNFVLMSDITSYVQIADLIGVKDGKMVMIEVKEGDKNGEILQDLHSISNPNDFEDLYDKYKNKYCCPIKLFEGTKI